MLTLAAGADRRRSLRAPIHGAAVIHARHEAVSGRLENLSLGGALLRADTRPRRHAALELELHLTRRRVPVAARAVRVERHEAGPRVAVRFVDLTADVEDAIEDEVVAALAAAKARRVLVIDGVEERRDDLADALRARAMTPLVPRTPLEVVDTLVADPHVELAVVSTRFGDLHGAEVARFITDQFPWIRIMVVADDTGQVAADVAATWDDIEARAW